MIKKLKISEILLNNNIDAIIISNTSDATRENFKKYSKTSKRVDYLENQLKTKSNF